MNKRRAALLGIFVLTAGLLSACSSVSDLSNVPPYNKYTGKKVPLVFDMPVEMDLKTGKPSKVVRAGDYVTVKRVYLEKTCLRGPIIPGVGSSTQIFAAIEYRDPITRSMASWNYPVGYKQSPYGHVEQIIAAPWEPASTPAFRYVGKDGKGFND